MGWPIWRGELLVSGSVEEKVFLGCLHPSESTKSAAMDGPAAKSQVRRARASILIYWLQTHLKKVHHHNS